MDEHDGRNDPQHGNVDPFAGLEEWARDAERRIQRERRLGGLRHKIVVAVGVVATLAVLAGGLSLVRWWTSDSGGDATAYPTQSAPDGVSATTSSSPARAGQEQDGQAEGGPFAGTPAAAYPKGAAGITLPTAKAVTGFTKAQVGAALQQVHRALVAGRLENDMLVGHHPQGLLKLLAPNQRDVAAKWFTSTRFTSVATWIDPAVRLDPAEQPRVSGRVTYASVRVDGIATLRVTTNFVWVYAFQGLEHPLAIEHDEIRWEFPSPRNLRSGDRGMWIGDTHSYAAWVDCTAAAKGLLAPTPPDTGTAPRPGETEDPDAYLRADHSLDIPDDCP